VQSILLIIKNTQKPTEAILHMFGRHPHFIWRRLCNCQSNTEHFEFLWEKYSAIAHLFE